MEIKHALVTFCHCDKHPRRMIKSIKGLFSVCFQMSVASGLHCSRSEERQSNRAVTVCGRGSCLPHGGQEAERARMRPRTKYLSRVYFPWPSSYRLSPPPKFHHVLIMPPSYESMNRLLMKPESLRSQSLPRSPAFEHR